MVKNTIQHHSTIFNPKQKKGFAASRLRLVRRANPRPKPGRRKMERCCRSRDLFLVEICLGSKWRNLSWFIHVYSSKMVM